MGCKSLAESNEVWNNFLLPDTDEILKSAEPGLDAKPSKELFLTLCKNPILIGEGKMVNSLHHPIVKILVTHPFNLNS